MNTEELKSMLKELNIPSRYYSINGDIASDIYVFQRVHTYWECFYIDERGGQNNTRRFADENSACEYFLNQLKKEIP